MPEQQELMRVAEVAKQLGVSDSRLYQLIAQGAVPCVRIGRSIRIPREAWRRWIAGHTDTALGLVHKPLEKR